MTRNDPTRISTILTLLLLVACTGDSDRQGKSGNVVNVYNWADYIGRDTIARFEAETGIEVNYDVYDAAAIVDVKLLTGSSGYDVVIHSNALSSRLTEIDIFQKLDTTLLPNIKNLDPAIMSKIDVYESVRGYSVPYHWGSTGFAWNADMIRERIPNQSMDTAAVLFDPNILSKLQDCGVSFLDGTTSLIPMALAYLDVDPNEISEDSLGKVERLLKPLRPYVRYFSNDKFISDLPNKELCVAMSWSGDYVTSAARAAEAGIDIDLRYTVTAEGASLWIDGIYIPSDAPHVANAHRFINYLMRADVAADSARQIGYANANAASWKYLDKSMLDNPAIYPDKEVWDRLFAVDPADPVLERLRTRTLARIKSGL